MGQHSTAWHSTAQHSTAQHSTAQHTPNGGLIIHGCHWQQEVGDVSNVHSQLEVAAGKLTHMQGVINVFAAGRVDATDRQMPQVFPAVSAWRQSVCGGSQCVEVLKQTNKRKDHAVIAMLLMGRCLQSSLRLMCGNVRVQTQKGKDNAMISTLQMGRCLKSSLQSVRGGIRTHTNQEG